MEHRQQRRLHSMALKLLRCRKNACPFSAKSTAPRIFCSSQISSDKTNQHERFSTQSVGSRDVYHLTQLFGKFLRSGEDRKAADVLNGMRFSDSRTGLVACNHLLNSCSKSRHSEMAKDVWSVMKDNGVQMNEISFGSMLCALTRGGCLDEAVDLLHVLYKRKIANVVMYNIVLNGCVHAKSKMYAARCVQLMEAQGVAKDEITYVELMKLSGVRGDLDSAKMWWAQLLQKHSPSPLARGPYIIALCRTNELAEAREELQKLVAEVGLQAQSPERKGMSPAQVSREAESLSRTGGIDDELHSEVVSPGPRMPKSKATVLISVQNAYNSLINAAGKTGDFELAETLFDEMRDFGLKTDIYTHNALVRAAVEGKGIQPALQIVKNLKSLGLRPDAHSFTALLEGYCRTQQLNEAEDMLNYMENGRRFQWATCYTFNILLKACAAQDDFHRALRVFGRMKESGVTPDGCTYLALLSACGNVEGGMDGNEVWSGQEVVKRVTAIELDMVRCGVPHTLETLTAVLNVLGAEGLTKEMLQRLEDADKHLLDASSFNTVILNCLNAKQLETGWEIYHQMKSSGLKPDLYTYNILINGCTQDKSVSTALKLIDTMRDEGVPPDMITYNSLLKVVSHSRQMDAVPELLQKMVADGVQCDSTTFNTVLTSASYQRRVDVTEHIIEEMRRRRIWPDLHTLLPVVTAYMRVNQPDDAVEALRVLSLRILEGENHLQQLNERDDDASVAAGGPKLDEEDSYLRSEDSATGEPGRGKDEMRELLMNAVLHATPKSVATYTAVLAGSIVDASNSWDQEHSSWAARLSRQYDRHRLLSQKCKL